jgi:two-component system, NtrC family, sensor histidine kinase HydH
MTASLRRNLQQLAERESLLAVNEFAASLAHEVRNPLSSVQLDLQQVEERLPPTSEIRDLQAQAIADLRRLDRTVAAALETARSGRVELRPVDLREPLRDAVRTAAPRFAQQQAHLDAAGAEGPPVVVDGDPDALRQVFLNVLLNAAAALGPGGSAAIAVAPDRGGTSVRIHDTGDGIPAEVLPRVFDPFYTTRPTGSGIGLAVARRIVTAHRGEIRIDSAPGTGTTVQLWLPGKT